MTVIIIFIIKFMITGWKVKRYNDRVKRTYQEKAEGTQSKWRNIITVANLGWSVSKFLLQNADLFTDVIYLATSDFREDVIMYILMLSFIPFILSFIYGIYQACAKKKLTQLYYLFGIDHLNMAFKIISNFSSFDADQQINREDEKGKIMRDILVFLPEDMI